MDPIRRQLVRAAVLGSAQLLAPSLRAQAGEPGAEERHAVGTGRRLVLVELAGANDGLNTVVPWRDERYRKLRPTLALPRAELHPLGAHELGLHAGLQPLLALLDAGEMAIVQGLGYPRPNRSHFASIALWERGGDGKSAGPSPYGWLTHDIEHRLARPVEHAHGISLEGSIGPMASASGRWLSARSVAALAAVERRGSQAGDTAGAAPPATDPIERMRARFGELDATLAALQRRLRQAPALAPYAAGTLGHQLREVARFVLAGLDVPVYRVRLPGFDTHKNQLGHHARQLGQVGDALRAFRDTLRASGEWRNTLVMTYSEFGRRAAENGSGGTDHGSAAPHLVLGGSLGSVNAPLGVAPDLGKLVDGDPMATMDYRALYERVLSDWFDIEDNRFIAYRDPALSTLLAS